MNRHRPSLCLKLLAFAGLLICTLAAHAAEIRVAVAANFAAPMEQIAARFNRDTGHKVLLSFGATGTLYAQIVSGAPFELFLAADDKMPARLGKERHADPATDFTYAVGKLVLWSANPDKVDATGNALKKGEFTRLAIANPDTAPYGKAAVETLEKLQLYPVVKSRLVMGENIGQTYQFVSTGNAELGFVALSQVFKDGKLQQGSAWQVPDNLHSPLRQNAILLNKGDNAAARALLDYLKSAQARAVISAYGYGF